jgi:hypothetical protein
LEEHDVEAAVNVLKARGEPVSVRRVHSFLGGHGSFRDISRHLRLLVLPNVLPDPDEEGVEVVTSDIEPAERAPTLIEQQTQRIEKAQAAEREALSAVHRTQEAAMALHRRLEASPPSASPETVAAVVQAHEDLLAQRATVRRQLALLEADCHAKAHQRQAEQAKLAELEQTHARAARDRWKARAAIPTLMAQNHHADQEATRAKQARDQYLREMVQAEEKALEVMISIAGRESVPDPEKPRPSWQLGGSLR